MSKYRQFLDNKRMVSTAAGFEPGPIHERAFPHQRDITRWACKRGRAALFEDCGLMKTGQEILWADQVSKHTQASVLMLAPWMVAEQTQTEAHELWDTEVTLCASPKDLKPGLNITNYEKLHKFSADGFAGIVCDESGILKAFDGKTRNQVIQFSRTIPYRLAATATPSPNDYTELGNHAEFLGIISMAEMLATFFVHDGGETSKWRLKGHAEKAFREWLSTWAVFLTKPSDLGYSDEGFELPPHEIILHVLDCGPSEGFLFPVEARTLQERRGARRSSIDDKVEAIQKLIVNTPSFLGGDSISGAERWLVWCGLNDEQDALAEAFGELGVSIEGSTSESDRSALFQEWKDGGRPIMVTKGRLFGWGMNLQVCHNMAMCSLSDSAEEFYQIVRRCLRFGQKHKVNVHVFLSELEMAVWRNVERKQKETDTLTRAMVDHMKDFSQREINGVTKEEIAYLPAQAMTIPGWLSA